MKTPKIFKAHGELWTAHTPGDPCPVPPETMVFCLPRAEEPQNELRPAFCWEWGLIFEHYESEIIGWRYADEQSKQEAQKYPCAKCGKLRTKAEGGSTFTVCNSCWNMDCPQQEAKADFGEPWRDSFGEIRDRDDFFLARFSSENAMSRAISCVNACVSMDDPAKEIAELRESVNALQAEREELLEVENCLREENTELRHKDEQVTHVFGNVMLENQKMREAIKEAYAALSCCYDVVVFPASGKTQQDDAITKLAPFVKEGSK